MNKIKRRDFLKHVGIGAGVLMTSNLLLNSFLSGCTSENGVPVGTGVFGLSEEEVKKLLEVALSKGGEFSELYFEHKISNSISMEEDLIKNTSESISLGVGIRVIKGQQTGYGYTNEMTFEKIKHAALTAAAIASGNSKSSVANLKAIKPAVQVYDMTVPMTKALLEDKLKIVEKANSAAKKYDSRISKVSVTLTDELKNITIANSEGLLVSDLRPQTRLMVFSTAEDKGIRTTGGANDGGRVGMDFYGKKISVEKIAERASEEAVILLDADNAPTGEMQVVLSKDQSGVMIHEAVGHPLEGDGAWKKSSIMWDKIGQEVANPIVTITDDATIPDYRGSLNIDDEGTATKDVLLIEKGKLVGFLNDKLSAKLLNQDANGHGRRQSYEFPPIPRMNNTILAPGESDPEEILKSVKKGFYAKTYQGGMVDNTGKFTFSVNLGYLIEDGKITKPLKNATLIGSNIQILKNVDMIGNDTGFFLGTCGKESQSVPVTCGTPTLRISNMTVGGSL